MGQSFGEESMTSRKRRIPAAWDTRLAGVDWLLPQHTATCSGLPVHPPLHWMVSLCQFPACLHEPAFLLQATHHRRHPRTRIPDLLRLNSSRSLAHAQPHSDKTTHSPAHTAYAQPDNPVLDCLLCVALLVLLAPRSSVSRQTNYYCCSPSSCLLNSHHLPVQHPFLLNLPAPHGRLISTRDIRLSPRLELWTTSPYSQRQWAHLDYQHYWPWPFHFQRSLPHFKSRLATSPPPPPQTPASSPSL